MLGFKKINNRCVERKRKLKSHPTIQIETHNYPLPCPDGKTWDGTQCIILVEDELFVPAIKQTMKAMECSSRMSKDGPNDDSMTSDECKSYAEKYHLGFNKTNNAKKPSKCYLDYEYVEVTSGNPSVASNPNYLNESECEAYADTKHIADFNSIANSALPYGCFYYDNSIWFNTQSTTNNCASIFKCIQKKIEISSEYLSPKQINDPGYVNELQCESYAKSLNIWGGVETTNEIPGCYKSDTKIFFNKNHNELKCNSFGNMRSCVFLPMTVHFNEADGTNCSSTHPCVNKWKYIDLKTGNCMDAKDKPFIQIQLSYNQGYYSLDKSLVITQQYQCQILNEDSVECPKCVCFDDDKHGRWDSFGCDRCRKGYGNNQCKQVCPGYDGVNEQTMCNYPHGMCQFGTIKQGNILEHPPVECLCGNYGKVGSGITNKGNDQMTIKNMD